MPRIITLEIMNAIRDEASPAYQNLVPVATQENFMKIGQAFAQYQTLYLEFADALMVKIGLTLIRQTSFENKLKRFKTGQLTSQQDVEEIFVQMAGAANKYNPAGPNPFGRRTGAQPKVVYHRLNRQDEYCETIGELDFIRAFRSPETADSFMMAKLQSMYTRAEYDEYNHMKNTLATFGHTPVYALTTDEALDAKKVYYTRTGAGTTPDPYAFHPVPADAQDVADIGTYYEDTAFGTSHGYFDYECLTVNNEASAKAFVKTVRKAAGDASYMSNKFNLSGVMDNCRSGDLVLLLNKDIAVESDVEMLSKAFNPSKTDIAIPDIVELDDFGTLPDTLGLMVHKDFFRIYDTYQAMKPAENAQGLFRNYFLHIHQILSCSPFRYAARFKKVSGT